MNPIIGILVILLVAHAAAADCEPDPPFEDHLRIDAVITIDPATYPALVEFRRRFVERPSRWSREKQEQFASDTVERYRGLLLVETNGANSKCYFIAENNPTRSHILGTGQTVRVWVDENCCHSDYGPPTLLGMTHYISRVLANDEEPPRQLSQDEIEQLAKARNELAIHWNLIYAEPLQFTNAIGSPEDMEFMKRALEKLSGQFYKMEPGP